MSKTVDRVRELLERRLAEIDQERQQLERALDSLKDGTSGSSGTSARTAGRSRGPRAGGQRRGGQSTGRRQRRTGRGRSSRRQSAADRAQALLDHVKKNPGASNDERAKALGVSTSRVSQLLTELRKDGRLKSRRRGTRASA